MPRISQNAEIYAKADFQQEIRRRQGHHNIMSVNALARELGEPESTLRFKLKDPFRLDVRRLRELVIRLQPDPKIVLALLGYDRKTIKKAMEDIQWPA